MRIGREQLLLYAVTDRSMTNENNLAAQVEEAILGGATLVQLRDKSLSYDELIQEATKLHELTLRYRIPLIINDNLEAVREVKAEGIHLGLSDMAVRDARRILGEEKIIGASAHTVEEALTAQADGADYLGVGAVFSSSTKKDARPLSRETLTAICQAVSIPVVAIGGITKENLSFLMNTGIDGVAVVSALFAEKNVKAAARQLTELVRNITTHLRI